MLAIMNTAAINMGKQMYLQDPILIFFRHIPRSENAAGVYGSSIFILFFLGNCTLFSIVAVTVYTLIIPFPSQPHQHLSRQRQHKKETTGQIHWLT